MRDVNRGDLLFHRVRKGIVYFAAVYIGVYITVVGVYNLFIAEPKYMGVPAKATIVANDRNTTTNGRGEQISIYTAEVEFLANNTQKRARLASLTSEKPYEIGKKIDIEYVLTNPIQVYLAPERGFKVLYSFLIVAGPFLLWRFMFPLLGVKIFKKIRESR